MNSKTMNGDEAPRNRRMEAKLRNVKRRRGSAEKKAGMKSRGKDRKK